MSLRRQLLIVALLLLSLPWAGCQFVREMEGALRQGQTEALQATAEAVAAVLSERPGLVYSDLQRRREAPDTARSIYAEPATSAPIVDGYADGWDDVPQQVFQRGATAVTLMAQTHGTTLYLLLKVADEELVYHNPGLSGEANGDRVVLRLWHGGRRQDYVINTAAPGQVRAKVMGKRFPGLDPNRINGYWQDAVGGYTLELALPLAYTGERLGFYVVDEQFVRGRDSAFVGNISRLDSGPPPWLIYSPAALQGLLPDFARRGAEITVLDHQQWRVGHAIGDTGTAASDDTFWLVRALYRAILDTDALTTPPPPPAPGKVAAPETEAALNSRVGSARYRDPASPGRSLGAVAVPVKDERGVMGAVLLRQSGETYLSLTDKAFSNLLGAAMAALGIGVLALLGYASVLSWRIRRLSLAASRAVEEDGRVRDDFRPSGANDEIGDLSRHYDDLLRRVRSYNDYLRTLSRKLSHELRTPIAVIQSSLENLQQEQPDSADTARYLDRARDGLARLQQILTSMSEASALEESIRSHPRQPVQLNALLQEVCAAYRDIYSGHHITLSLPPNNAVVQGSADLLVQALDKLVANAASFCPEGGRISLSLTGDGEQWHLRVFNEGPPLPEHTDSDLFDAMVSHRTAGDPDVHLGLGLHIARLIADYHQGTVTLENAEDGSGVIAVLALPWAG